VKRSPAKTAPTAAAVDKSGAIFASAIQGARVEQSQKGHRAEDHREWSIPDRWGEQLELKEVGDVAAQG